ncbi:hypothetical protein DERP_008351 [Dermatophagoides pteronyssinus]|uniref:Uncharacterized protein n=1 Tax=Dermatophagoides pteronyssinus TaxID=6956 RepID=A0ABQ8J682_DERPT|nr:hypothetical protein DERP_008351 [Dermatophagoides pteronyssinus]
MNPLIFESIVGVLFTSTIKFGFLIKFTQNLNVPLVDKSLVRNISGIALCINTEPDDELDDSLLISSNDDSVRRNINCGYFDVTDFSTNCNNNVRKTSVAYSIRSISMTINNDATFTLFEKKKLKQNK